MDKRYLIAAAIIAALIGGAVWWQRGAGKRALAQCAQLESQRALLAVSGANADDLARLDIAINTCKGQAAALGESIDSGASVLAGCEVKRKAAHSEFSAYKSTATEDAIQRNNKRQNILHIADELVSCYRDAVSAATSVATIDEIRKSINLAITQSNERQKCYFENQPGCGRFGVNEDHGNDKAEHERIRVLHPLQDVLAVANAKRDELRTAERNRAREASETRAAA